MAAAAKQFGQKQVIQGARLAMVGVPALLGLIILLLGQWRPGVGFLLIAAALAAVVLPFRLNPLTQRKIRRFKGIKRGYWSFITLIVLLILSLFAEFFVNNKALVVRYDGEYYFPVVSRVLLGDTFGLTGSQAQTPVNYRQLDQFFEEGGGENWVIMPPIPYSPNENIPYEGVLKPRPPSREAKHYLGTDSTGRDIVARLVYGIRIAMFFALAYAAAVFLIGVTIGCLMGYFGGWFDLISQRLVEIWSLVPFLYMVIIVYSVIPVSIEASSRISILLLIMAIFGWITLTYYIRTAVYREKARDYAAAAVVIGAGSGRVIFSHLLPNAVSTIVTFLPFVFAAAITAVTALDFLGFGLPPPTPSIGEILQQGTSRLNAPWIVTSAFVTLVFLLTLVTFVGEAVREAFDPKQFSYYR